MTMSWVLPARRTQFDDELCEDARIFAFEQRDAGKLQVAQLKTLPKVIENRGWCVFF